jgi:hypothetical protein
MIRRKITIEVWGETVAEVDEAFEEAYDRLRDGNVMGADRNESGGFMFTNEDASKEDQFEKDSIDAILNS